jgi:hypothetical protein
LIQACVEFTVDLESPRSLADGDDALRQERCCCWRCPDKITFCASQSLFTVPKAVNDFRGFRLVMPVKAGS